MTNKKNILVTGADGQLGMELRSLAELYQDYEFFFASKNDLQITDTVAVEKYFTQHAITHCINCAAYTAVDKAEREKEIAFENNGIAVGNIAAICKKMMPYSFIFLPIMFLMADQQILIKKQMLQIL